MSDDDERATWGYWWRMIKAYRPNRFELLVVLPGCVVMIALWGWQIGSMLKAFLLGPPMILCAWLMFELAAQLWRR